MLRLPPRARTGLGLVALLVLAAALRWPFWREALRTPLDGDTSLLALMALHPAQTGTTLWGQPYGSPLEAWLLAPFLALTGPRSLTVHVFYFTLGLLLVPAAFLVARRLEPGIEWHAATLAAAPSAYLLLLSASPPPLYPLELLMCAALLGGALALERRLARGEAVGLALLLWGGLAGLAFWTHLMAASVVATGLAFLACSAGPLRRRLWPALVGLVLGAWPLALGFDWSVAASSRQTESFLEHLRDLLPALHRPLAGLLGGHAPLLCDDERHVVGAPLLVALTLAIVAAWALAAAWRSPRPPGVALLGWCLAACVMLFVLPARSSPHTLRFLTPAWLPGLLLMARGAVARLGARRAWAVVALVCGLQLVCSVRLLQAWHAADRRAAPFLLPDLEPVRGFLEARGVHHAYAEYATAYRLTFESGERLVASPPWNERFRHHPLPLLDEVRYGGRVAWILRDAMASDLPTTRLFEAALAPLGGRWQKRALGDAVVYWDFRPPFGPALASPTAPGPLVDGDVTTFEARGPGQSVEVTLHPGQPPAALTVLTPPRGAALPRAFAVEASLDGQRFEVLERWRPEDARGRPLWLNGHPQYAAERDAFSLALPPRPWRALRLVSSDPRDEWSVAELLVHPAGDPSGWEAAALETWPARRARAADPARARRADTLFRGMLAGRHQGSGLAPRR